MSGEALKGHLDLLLAAFRGRPAHEYSIVAELKAPSGLPAARRPPPAARPGKGSALARAAVIGAVSGGSLSER